MTATGLASNERFRAAAGKFVARRSEDQLARLEHGPQRRVMLETIFAAMRRRFDPEVARDLDAVVEFRLLGDGGGAAERYQVRIAGGQCTVTRNGTADPVVWFTLGAADLLRMGTGAVSWLQLLGERKVELGGDPFTGMWVLNIFGIPPRAAGA